MLLNIITYIGIFVKEREKTRLVRPKVGEEKGLPYRVREVNIPNASLLLSLIEVVEKEQLE